MALNDDIYNRVNEIYTQMGNTVEANAQIAREAQAAGLNPSQLSSALNVPETEISRLASEAGVPFTPPASTPPISSPDFSNLSPLVGYDTSALGSFTPPASTSNNNNNVTIGGGGPSATVGSGTSGITVGTTGQQTPGATVLPLVDGTSAGGISVGSGTSGITASTGQVPGVTIAPPTSSGTGIMPDPSKYGITPGPDFGQYADSIFGSQQAAEQVSQDVLNAGGLNNYLAQQYEAGNIDAVNNVLAASNMTAKDLVEQFNLTEGDLNQLSASGVKASGMPEIAPPPPPPVEIPNVQDVTVTDSSGNPVTYQFGSEVNDAIANAWVEGTETGDYSKVQQLLVNAGYSIDDVQKQFGLDADAMAAIKNAGVTGAEPEDSVITGLYEDITTLLENNQNAQKEIDTLNQVLAGLNLTIEDLRNNYALSQDDVDYIESIGIGGYSPLAEGVPGTIQQGMLSRAISGARPVDAEGNVVGAMQPAQIGEATTQQVIGAGVGQVGEAPQATMQTAATTAQATAPTMQTAAQVTAQDATPNVSDALQQVAPAQGSVSTNAQVQAAQMSPTATEVGTVGAAQIAEAQQVQQPQSRTLQEGELVTAAADAQQAAAFAEQVGAATADPTSKATVQGQLADLMTQFEGGEVPAWAAGAMRQANATLAARGLGASSIAGQAVVQAAMEASLPIASADAATVAQFELTNLSNRQQRAMLAAQQRAQFIGQEFDQQFQARVSNAARIADIANLNFNAEQQVALENARLAQSVDLANLQNTQALVMAEAAQIANIETTNLNNRQQAAVQNAQSFLQMDLTNLSNQQQTDMFKAQSTVQSLLSDQAAENAARQFNASSENQTNQFFANLNAQISQYNATQNNAMSQFNAEQSNVVNRFNAELQAQRDQFNAQNQLVIEQSNAQWRRELATADTAAQNLANQFNAQAILDISNTAYAQLWQSYRDDMEFAWTSGENERDRLAQLALQKLQVDASKYAADAKEDGSFASALGTFAATVVSNW